MLIQLFSFSLKVYHKIATNKNNCFCDYSNFYIFAVVFRQRSWRTKV